MQPLGVVLFVVSFVSWAIYTTALYRLLMQPHHRGIVRTAACRVAGALLYIGLGAISATGYAHAGEIAIGVFSAVQVMWWCNSMADVWITRVENKQKGRSDAQTATRLPQQTKVARPLSDGKHHRPNKASQ